MRRLILIAAVALAPLSAHADQILGQAQLITSNNAIVLPGGPTLGLWSGGKYTETPDVLQIKGTGSTGDVSGMSVTAIAGAQVGTLAQWLYSPSFAGPFAADALNILPESATPTALPVQSVTPDTTFVGRHYAVHASPAGRTKAFVGSAVTVDAGGSGTNGPLTADYAGSLSVIKRGFPSSTAIGEIDGLLIYARQSGPTPTSDATSSDIDGLQLNIATVNDPGYSAAAELLTTRTTSPTYAQTHSIGLQMGVNDAFGKNTEQNLGRYAAVNRLTYAYGALANQGTLDRAFYATDSAQGSWQDYFMGGGGASPNIRIKGGGSATPGAIVLGPDTHTITVRKDASDNLIVVNNAGTQTFQISQGGTVTMSAATLLGLLTPAQTTVANLTACTASTKGAIAVMTDVSAAPTYRQTGLTGGGSISVPVFCNGAAWEAH